MRDKQKMLEVAARLRTVIDRSVNVLRSYKTQEAWGNHYGISKQALTNCLRGDNYPDIQAMMMMCHEEGLTLDWLYRGIPAGVAAFWAEYLKQPRPASLEASRVKEPQAP